MDERIPPGTYFQYSSGVHSSPHHSMRSPASSDRERLIAFTNGQMLSISFSSSGSLCHFLVTQSYVNRYLAELLAERQKLVPFVQVLPFCCRLLNQEIVRASGLAPNQSFVDPERIEHGSPLRLTGHPSNGGPMDLEGWPGMQTELSTGRMSWTS